jgi:hypothetical protein
MKLFIIALTFLPAMLMAQENYREATKEEKQHILTGQDADELKKIGAKLANQSENSALEKMIIHETIEKGFSDPDKMKAYVHQLRNQGMSQEEVDKNLKRVSEQYFAELQIKNLHKILPEELVKDFEIKFNELEKKRDEGKLTKEELQLETDKLDREIAKSHTTIQDEQKLETFQKSFSKIAQDSSFVKEPIVFNPKHFSEIKIMVPNDFSLKGQSQNEPLCLTKPQVTISKQIDLLNTQMKELAKPPVYQVWFAWGYNRGYHSKTDVKFTTKDGTFTVHDAFGKDRQSPVHIKYLTPSGLTIPQYNIELGVMFNEKWGMDVHMDHMKYVFDNTRPYEITGSYNHQVVTNSGPVDFSVAQANKDATWLRFEHTNGYNYASLGAVYNQNIVKTKNKAFAIDARFGAGAGLVIPKTEVWIYQDQPTVRYGIDNKFHVAGGGIHGDARLKITFWDSFFIQAATRGTYIKVKNALVDGAEARMEHLQPITSFQIMGQIGYQHTFGNKKAKKK